MGNIHLGHSVRRTLDNRVVVLDPRKRPVSGPLEPHRAVDLVRRLENQLNWGERGWRDLSQLDNDRVRRALGL